MTTYDKSMKAVKRSCPSVNNEIVGLKSRGNNRNREDFGRNRMSQSF